MKVYPFIFTFEVEDFKMSICNVNLGVLLGLLIGLALGAVFGFWLALERELKPFELETYCPFRRNSRKHCSKKCELWNDTIGTCSFNRRTVD